MNFRGYRLDVIIITVIIALILFFGGQSFYTSHWKQKPVLQEIEKISGVKEAILVSKEDGLYLQIEFFEVTDFLATYNQVFSLGRDGLGENFKGIILVEKNTGEWEEAIYQLQFPLYHSLLTGDLGTLRDDLQKIRNSLGLDLLKVQLSPKGIFVHLREEESEYFQILPWLNSARVEEGGGSHS